MNKNNMMNLCHNGVRLKREQNENIVREIERENHTKEEKTVPSANSKYKDKYIR